MSSSSADALKNTDAKRLIADVLSDFSIRFIAQYKNASVKKAIFESRSAAEDNWVDGNMLMKCPKISYELKRGLVSNRSVWRKKFQERILVVHNEVRKTILICSLGGVVNLSQNYICTVSKLPSGILSTRSYRW